MSTEDLNNGKEKKNGQNYQRTNKKKHNKIINDYLFGISFSFSVESIVCLSLVALKRYHNLIY